MKFCCRAALHSLALSFLVLCYEACSSHSRREEGKNPIQFTAAIIFRADQPLDNPDLRAYGETFSAVSLGWRVEPLSVLEQTSSPVPGLILVVPARTARSLRPSQVFRLKKLVQSGAVLVTEEITPLSESFGFRGESPEQVSQLEEIAFPEVEIAWQHPLSVMTLGIPPSATVLTRERNTGGTLASLLSLGRGSCLLLAAELDSDQGDGYHRYPYFLHELRRAGVRFPFRSERLTALFDSADRPEKDLEILAQQWRAAGIQSLQVGAWDFIDGDPKMDHYLDILITVCHRNGILVYAWFELPHVSIDFWKKHPQWRERTASGQEAQLDWRYLMNLKNENCFQAVANAIRKLLERFDWDGANLAELYFESPDGAEDPTDFTPMNSEVRMEFKRRYGLDPAEYFNKESPSYWRKDPIGYAKFVDYRVETERLLNERFLQLLSDFRHDSGRNLDLILLYIDNIYDPKMREGVGADIREILPLLDKFDCTLVLEDPWTTWHLGPRRYSELAQSYARLTRHTDRLGIDINVVDRAQQVYPTKKQTGVEFLQLFRHAASRFNTVMVYSEHSIHNQDLELVAHAMATGASGTAVEGGVRINSPGTILYQSDIDASAVTVDGKPWPCWSGKDILLPAGSHLIAVHAAKDMGRPRLVKLNGALESAAYMGDRDIDISYKTKPRAIAIFDRIPESIAIDGVVTATPTAPFIMLPGGSHTLRAKF